MPVPTETRAAMAASELEGEVLVVTIAGEWKLMEPRPSWPEVLDQRQPKRVRVVAGALAHWDSSLLLFLFDVQQWSEINGIYAEVDRLPEKVRQLLAQMSTSHETSFPVPREQGFLTTVGLATREAGLKVRDIFSFVGEASLAAGQLMKNPRHFRWRDCLTEMQQCGAMALPIVSLISLLVGFIMAYQAAVQLRQFGADIYVADLVGLSVVREMGPMMAAIIVAGRTGAAFAASLGNMKANEEIDALTTLGIAPVHFLVLPRLLALAVMMPLLAVYANCLGIIGGVVVGLVILQIPPAAYWVETRSIIDVSDVMTGIIKATAFGSLIGLSGCLRGLQAERSAAGVGRAATSAVVTSILLIIVADALFAIIFNVLHW